jgi:hypothetical protein
MRSADLEAVLAAHAYLRVERPPQLWDTDVELEAFLRLLGEMIAAGLVRNGGVLSEIALNVSNVTVEPEAGAAVPPGDFLALTVRSAGRWGPEATWQPGVTEVAPFVSADLEAAARHARAAYGYSRSLVDDQSSLTIFLRRTATSTERPA